MLYHTLLLLAFASRLMAQTCEECDSCFITVTGTADVTLAEYLYKSPLYVQAVSPSSQYQGIDSICFDFNSTIAESTSIMRTIITKSDMSTIDLPYIEKEYDAGAFGGVGPMFPVYKDSSVGAVATNDFTIDHPCDSVYVMKRCFRLGGITPCPPAEKIPVFILSTKKKEDNSNCIAQGIQTANKENGNLDFMTLPRKSKNPCPSLSSGSGSGIGVLGGISLSTIVDVPDFVTWLF